MKTGGGKEKERGRVGGEPQFVTFFVRIHIYTLPAAGLHTPFLLCS